ncbi:hypothetical protein IJM86_06265 [bacterium]|nr:hypothetical protein [bacterium]
MKGSLQIQENENDPEEPIEGAIKMVNNCMCYGDGQKWKATKGDIFCDMICKKPGLKV